MNFIKSTFYILLTIISISVKANGNDGFSILDSIDLYFQKSDYSKSLELSRKALENTVIKSDDSLYIKTLTLASLSSDYLGKYDECQKYNYELLDIYTEKKDMLGIGSALNDISIIHYYKNNYSDALKYAEKSLKLHLKLNDTMGIAMCYNNIANCYADDGDLLKGLEFYFKALEYYEYLNDSEGQVICLGNIGDSYQELDSLKLAKKYLQNAIDVSLKDSMDEFYLVPQYTGLARLELKNNNPKLSLIYSEKARDISRLNSYLAELCTSYMQISEAYEMLEDFEKSLEYYKLYYDLNDTIYQNENSSLIEELNVKYNLSEKEKQIEIKNTELEKERLIAKRNKWIIALFILVILIVLVFSYIVFRENKRRRWVNDALNKTNDKLEQSIEDVRASIQYARKIQDAILPEVDEFKKSFPESFIFYKPKDVVSGDFYWFEKLNDISYFAVVDCTGHGVPGAFMSMMASNLLNQIVLDEKVKHPSEAFYQLDSKLKYNLHHNKYSVNSSSDGFDLTLISFDKKDNKVSYCGAKNDLYVISDGDLQIKKASRSSIGGNIEEKKFVGGEFKVKKGDCIYLFTDGFPDQFGGSKDKKYSYKRLRNELINIHSKPMNEQKNHLKQVFKDWKGNNEQIDDICIAGIKF